MKAVVVIFPGSNRERDLCAALAIVTGRQPLTALDTYIKDWKSRGGDMIRQEYQQSLKG